MILRILAWIGLSTVALAALAASAFAYFIYAPAPAPPQLSGTWSDGETEIGGRQRSYRVYMPASFTPGAPLLVVLHGSDGGVEKIRRETGFGFDRLADTQGFAVAYPRGFEGNWNGCNRVGDYSANALDIDDVAFITAMVDELIQEHAIDGDRVFAVGLSRGGHMAYRLALEAPSRFRAVAAVAASLPTEDNFKCTPAAAPPSVMIMNGTDDPLNPFDGGEVRLLGLFNRGTVISSRETAAYFADLAGASASAPEAQTFGRTRIDHTRWRSEAGAEIQLSAVRGGGHVLPQAEWRSPRILGRTPRDVDGPAVIWSFFERQMQSQGMEE